MKTSIRIDGLMVATVATLGVGAYLLTRPKDSLNPASPNNVVYSGVSSIGEQMTGQKGWTLGGQLYDWFGDKPEVPR